MSLEFIEDTHTYLIEGKEVPSVSEITRFIQRELYKEADPMSMEVAADRGTRVHRACEEIDRTGAAEINPNDAGYLQAYMKFLKEHDAQWELIEHPFYSAIMFNEADDPKKFAGTLDRYGLVDGVPTLLDIKTTKRITGKHKTQYGTQLTAYSFCGDVITFKSMMVLQLMDDGTYKLFEFKKDYEKYVELFESCMRLHYALDTGRKRRK